MRAAAIQREPIDDDFQRRERVSPFLRLSSIHDALAEERALALDQLQVAVRDLERLGSWRSTSSVDFDPYVALLRKGLREARRRFGGRLSATVQEDYLLAANHLTRLLRDLTRGPASIREPLATIEDVRVATG